MTATVRRGLQNIRTRSGATTDEQNPQRKFLRVANLELRKTLCNKVREAARVRVVEMDEQLAEIEDEQSRLLAAAHASRRVMPTTGPGRPFSSYVSRRKLSRTLHRSSITGVRATFFRLRYRSEHLSPQ